MDGDAPYGTPSGDSYFNYAKDGQAISIAGWEAQRSEDTFMVIGAGSDGTAIELNFNAFGNMGGIWAYNINAIQQDKRNHYFFKQHYFDFELIAVDNQLNTVEVAFSGYLYDDEYDTNSSYSYVEGSFKIPYIDVTPIVSGVKVSADINGQQWHATEQYSFENDYQTLSFVSDDQYVLSFIMPTEGSFVGTNSFNSNSAYNKVVLSKYNTETQQLEEYTTAEGTLNITFQSPGIIEGDFNLTTSNITAGETVTITHGEFKILSN